MNYILLKILLWVGVIYIIGILIGQLIRQMDEIKFATHIDIGDVLYKTIHYKENPFTDTSVIRLRVLDIRNGWVKYTHIRDNEFRIDHSPSYYAKITDLYEDGYHIEDHDSYNHKDTYYNLFDTDKINKD